MSFTFKDTEIAVLKNLSSINPSMVIEPTRFSVINESKSVVSYYQFDDSYDYEEFGIYEVPEFLSVLATLKNPTIEPKEKYLIIGDTNSKFKYFTTSKDLLPKVFDVKSKFAKVKCPIEFDISSEKLQLIYKTANILKADYVFVQSDEKKVRLTVANELNSSSSSFEITIEDGIKTNELADKVIKIPICDMKLYQGDYTVQIAEKISCWKNIMGNLEYYIGTNVV